MELSLSAAFAPDLCAVKCSGSNRGRLWSAVVHVGVGVQDVSSNRARIASFDNR
jgi:hypothetical protein